MVNVEIAILLLSALKGKIFSYIRIIFPVFSFIDVLNQESTLPFSKVGIFNIVKIAFSVSLIYY